MEGDRSLINGLPGGQEYWDSYYGLELEACYAISKGTRYESSAAAEPYKRALDQHGEDSPQGKRAGEISDLITHLHRINAYGGLRDAARKIEMTEQFTIL